MQSFSLMLRRRSRSWDKGLFVGIAGAKSFELQVELFNVVFFSQVAKTGRAEFVTFFSTVLTMPVDNYNLRLYVARMASQPAPRYAIELGT